MKTEIVKKVLLQEGVKKAGMVGAVALGAGALVNAITKPKDDKEVLDYMQYTPATLSAQSGVYMSMGPREGESLDDFLARMQLEREKKIYDDDDYDEGFYENIEDKLQEGALIEDKETLKEALDSMKTPRIRKITQNLYNNGVLYDTTVGLLSEIEQKMVHIKDTKVLSLIYKMCDELANLQVGEEERESVFGHTYIATSAADLCKIERLLETIDKMIDSYNNITNKYVTYKDYRYDSDGVLYKDSCKTQKFVECFDNDEEDNKLKVYLKQEIFDEKKLENLFVRDFLTAQKTENLIPLRDGEEKDYLYNIYLKNADLPKSIKTRCKKIKEEFGIMIFPPFKRDIISKYFDFIEEELNAWKEAGGDEVIYPKVLDLNLIDERFAYEGTEGYCDSGTRKIQLKGDKLSNLRFALRHELMHLNDKLINTHMIGQERAKFLEEIMPIIILDGHEIRDFKNCKYKDEFLRAGIDPMHVTYAYKERVEFIAVAAEGDMSKYSPEFKEVLKRLGMPDFAFNLKTINRDVQRRVELMEKVFEKYPDEKNFAKLVKYYEKEKAENKPVEEILLKILFGEKF